MALALPVAGSLLPLGPCLCRHCCTAACLLLRLVWQQARRLKVPGLGLLRMGSCVMVVRGRGKMMLNSAGRVWPRGHTGAITCARFCSVSAQGAQAIRAAQERREREREQSQALLQHCSKRHAGTHMQTG